jgi:hypothetical protein
MRYDNPAIQLLSSAGKLILSHDGAKGSATCRDSNDHVTSNGAYEVDE